MKISLSIVFGVLLFATLMFNGVMIITTLENLDRLTAALRSCAHETAIPPTR